MQKEVQLKNFLRAAAWIAVCAAALAVRYLEPFPALWVSSDMHDWVFPWIRAISEQGWDIYGTAFTNYAPAYTYLLWPVAQLPSRLWLSGTKCISIGFDIVMAVAVYWIISTLLKGRPGQDRPNAPWLGAAVTLWLPTVWMNSTAWGQCDSIWAAFCLLSLLAYLRNSPVWAMICFALALSVKLQAVFFSPVVLLMLLSGRGRWWQLVLVPAVYALTCLPCALAGREWGDLAGIYLSQYSDQPFWTHNSASICYLLRLWPYNETVGMVIVAVAIVAMLWIVVKAWKRLSALSEQEQKELTVGFAAFCAVAIPWALPMMHERYFFLGDVLTALCAVYFATRRWIWTAVCVEVASAINVVWYLTYLGALFRPELSLRYTNVPPLVLVTIAIYLMCKRPRAALVDANN